MKKKNLFLDLDELSNRRLFFYCCLWWTQLFETGCNFISWDLKLIKKSKLILVWRKCVAVKLAFQSGCQANKLESKGVDNKYGLFQPTLSCTNEEKNKADVAGKVTLQETRHVYWRNNYFFVSYSFNRVLKFLYICFVCLY